VRRAERRAGLACALALALGAIACAAPPALPAASGPAMLDGRCEASALRFSGQSALSTLTDFVTRFPHRHSGQPNNRAAAAWIEARLRGLGMACAIDTWEVVNYSRPVTLGNVVCRLAGASPAEIVIMAHHDQSPRTVQGADNDGSGIAILLELAAGFAAGPRPAHTLVFVATDAEEYGMLGSLRFVSTHPEPSRILAGISLDNLGKRFYDGLDMTAIGQFRHHGALWLQRAARTAARACGLAWVPMVPAPMDQVLGQAVPISFTDQGPLVAAGVPAFGLGGHAPPAHRELHWETYHSPLDDVSLQSAEVLGHAGRATEALVRQLLAMERVPDRDTGPYVYFADTERVLRGAGLWLIFGGFVLVWLIPYGRPGRDLASLRAALAHLAGLWLPLVALLPVLYGLVAVGWMDAYHLYPATTRDPALYEPRWPAVAAALIALALLLALGRWVSARLGAGAAGIAARRRLARLVIGLAGLYVLAVNPFSLLFFLPLPCWLLIGGRRSAGRLTRRLIDIALFLAGCGWLFALIYVFGFEVLRNDLAVLWYLMMMFSIRMIGFVTGAVLLAVLAAGLSLVVSPPGARRTRWLARRIPWLTKGTAISAQGD
jgi:hypothetical protein